MLVTQVFVAARHQESIGNYKEADKLYALCDKMIANVLESKQNDKQNQTY